MRPDLKCLDETREIVRQFYESFFNGDTEPKTEEHSRLGTAHANSARASADLRGANLRGAHLFNAWLDGTDLTGANLRGAVADHYTIWPEDFDPVAAGVIFE